MNNDEPFVGYGIGLQNHQIFTGTHNYLQVGEKWTIPDYTWSKRQQKKLRIGKKQSGTGWLWSTELYPEFVKNMYSRFGKKGFTTLYVTHYGHMLKPVDPEDISNVQNQLIKINQSHPASMNSMSTRIKNGGRKHKTVYVVIGNVRDYPELMRSLPLLK